MKRLKFAIIGAAGYIAPRHLDAVAALGHELVAAFDLSDSVGILDRYAPDAQFFTELERFERYLYKAKIADEGIDYLIVCSPNHLHDTHCRLGLRLGADVICEKPVTLNVRNLEALRIAEKESGRSIWSILQIRLHPEFLRLQLSLKQRPKPRHQVSIQYITPRGTWYDYSWKGDLTKSGGVATNIGIHLLDAICTLFGQPSLVQVTSAQARQLHGKLTFTAADVDFHVSVRREDLPAGTTLPHRQFVVDGEAYDFSQSFENLHRLSYDKILAGKGFSLSEAQPAIAVAEALRS